VAVAVLRLLVVWVLEGQGPVVTALRAQVETVLSIPVVAVVVTTTLETLRVPVVRALSM
jgi:hypothetical protein